MLHVQEYLQSKTLEDLTNELGIVVKKHDSLPLVILNYNQLESPKLHPIVRECRALVLNTNDWSIVAKSFSRFFNWGEVAEEMPLFDFSDFIVDSKEDGSLVLIYHFDGQWRVNTRGSFATDDMQHQTFSWQEGICKALGVKDLRELDGELNEDTTYVCEFVSPWNKVVRRYEKPQMYLLTACVGETELTADDTDRLMTARFLRPTRYRFESMDEIMVFLKEQEAADPTFEGVVIRDRNNRRWKIKNPCYLALHRLKGEGDNLFAPKNLLPFVMSGETAELLCYFPEVTEALNLLQQQIDEFFANLVELWQQTHKIESQKDFALAIQKKTPFTGLLFQLRKEHGDDQTLDDLKSKWRDSSDVILKVVKDTRPVAASI